MCPEPSEEVCELVEKKFSKSVVLLAKLSNVAEQLVGSASVLDHKDCIVDVRLVEELKVLLKKLNEV